MTDDAVLQFGNAAPGYESKRRCIVPGYDAFYGTAVAALALAGRDIRRVLDLGAGTGLLTGHIAAAYPGVELTLLDGAAAMLARAQTRFVDAATYTLADFADPLPSGPWDAIVSALAIHHLDDPGKQALFARVHAALAPGGMFVNAEQVAGPTSFFEDAYHRWHEHRVKELGTTDADWAAAIQRMRHDRSASVEHHLAWLREAGFADADCLWKDHRLAVLAARRAG